ncbi:MAG: response regulator [Brachymonas sp.]|nr:response regulator [Brachymonas sp.]
MKFPLYHRPSAIVFLDDETPYLEMLAMVLPQSWCIRFHTRVRDYLAEIRTQAEQWDADVAQHQTIINQWHIGKPLPGQILNYWRTQRGRYGLPSIAVVDYAMPAANGLDVLKVSPPWPPYRVLLTGKADEHTAVAAFNEGLIDRFVTKQTPDLVQKLIHALREHYSSPMDFHEGIWRNSLKRHQAQVLQDKTVQQAIRDWLQEQACVEYFILPEPFGLLALDINGFTHWLQFELRQHLGSAADLASAAGHDASTVASIAQGKILSDAEWQQSVGINNAPQVAPTLAMGTDGHLIVAHFPQKELGTAGLGYRTYLSSLPERGVDLDSCEASDAAKS